GDHQVADPAAGLAPDLRPGVAIVHIGVHRIEVLVGEDRAGGLPNDLLGLHPVVVRVIGRNGRGSDYDLGAVRLEHPDLFLRHLVRHGEHAAIALYRGRHRESDAGVAAGRLDDGAARLEAALGLRVLDDGQTDAVLHRAARVLVLGLGVDRCTDAAAQPSQADERGPPDRVEHRVVGREVLGLHTPTFSPADCGIGSAGEMPSPPGSLRAPRARSGAGAPLRWRPSRRRGSRWIRPPGLTPGRRPPWRPRTDGAQRYL